MSIIKAVSMHNIRGTVGKINPYLFHEHHKINKLWKFLAVAEITKYF